MTLAASTVAGTGLSDEPEGASLTLALTVGVSMGFNAGRVLSSVAIDPGLARKVDYTGGRSGVQFDGQPGRVIE